MCKPPVYNVKRSSVTWSLHKNVRVRTRHHRPGSFSKRSRRHHRNAKQQLDIIDYNLTLNEQPENSKRRSDLKAESDMMWDVLTFRAQVDQTDDLGQTKPTGKTHSTPGLLCNFEHPQPSHRSDTHLPPVRWINTHRSKDICTSRIGLVISHTQDVMPAQSDMAVRV